MGKVAAWPDFIRSITRWDRVEPGTLTLDNVQPLPGPALRSVDSLGVEPNDIFNDCCAQYADFLRQRRGERRFYGAIARAGSCSHVAAISQQITPTKEDRLEVYSDAKLRDVGMFYRLRPVMWLRLTFSTRQIGRRSPSRDHELAEPRRGGVSLNPNKGLETRTRDWRVVNKPKTVSIPPDIARQATVRRVWFGSPRSEDQGVHCLPRLPP